MLGTFMEEMQITAQQFEIACLEGRQNTAAGSAFSFHQGLFQQVSESLKLNVVTARRMFILLCTYSYQNRFMPAK